MYEKKPIVSDTGLVTVKMTDINGAEVTVTKGSIRNALVEAGIDTEDSLSDTSKIASLTLSMAVAIYSILPEEYKATLPVDKREFIEYTASKFVSVNTWADLQLQAEGKVLIDKLMENQAIIAKIVSEHKGISIA